MKFGESKKGYGLASAAPLESDILSPNRERKHLFVSEGAKLLFFHADQFGSIFKLINSE